VRAKGIISTIASRDDETIFVALRSSTRHVQARPAQTLVVL
jgi:hypothetical protein